MKKNPTQYTHVQSKQEKKEKRFYTSEQEELVKGIALRYLPGIVLSLETGIRPGEFTGVKWSDIEDGVLLIKRSIAYNKATGFIERPPKWNSFRAIPLTELALQALNVMKNQNNIHLSPISQLSIYSKGMG